MTPTLALAALLAAPPDAAEILRGADTAILNEHATYALRMSVTRPGKPARIVEMKGWRMGDVRGLVRYTAPAKERGTAYLRNGGSTYLFLPAAEKVVRVGPKQNFGGSDFSNGDIFRLSLRSDYVPTLVGEEEIDGHRAYRLELKAKDRSVAYDRVTYWVRTDGTFFPLRAEYYTVSGRKLKWLTVRDVQKLGSRLRPVTMVMENALEPGATTTLQFLAIDDAPKLDERMFTPAALERGE